MRPDSIKAKAARKKARPNSKPKVTIACDEQEDGSHRIALVVSGLRVERIRNNLIFIADLDTVLPVKFSYNEHKFYPKLVLKVYRKFKNKTVNQLHARRYAAKATRFV